MKLKDTLPYFLLALQEGKDFPIEPMQELDGILSELESDEEKTIATVKSWFRNHQDIYEDIIQFARGIEPESDRQKKESKPEPPDGEIGIVQNLYELREKNPHKDDRQNKPSQSI